MFEPIEDLLAEGKEIVRCSLRTSRMPVYQGKAVIFEDNAFSLLIEEPIQGFNNGISATKMLVAEESVDFTHIVHARNELTHIATPRLISRIPLLGAVGGDVHSIGAGLGYSIKNLPHQIRSIVGQEENLQN